jgi:hypothetical protein
LQRILKLFSVILHFSVEFIPHVWDCLLVAASDTQPEPTNMTKETKQAINNAKLSLKKNGRKFAGYIFKDGFGVDEQYPPNSKFAVYAIESAEEVGGGIRKIYPNFLDQIVIES